MLTPEREKEIRDRLEVGSVRSPHATVSELLAELDRVRAESCADLIGQEHRLGTRTEILEIERDQLRAKLDLAEFRLKHIAQNTECIGLEKCHVDGNCIHCLATIRGDLSSKHETR